MKLLNSKYLNVSPARVAVAALMALMLFSCAREVEIIDGEKKTPNPDATGSTFTVSAAPSSKSLVATRGSIPEDLVEDNKVEDITILLFKSESPHAFVTAAYLDNKDTNNGNDITKLSDSPSERKYKFTANLPKGTYKALFLANAMTDFIEDKYDIYGETPTYTTITGNAPMTALTIEQIENALVREDLTGRYPTVGEEDYRPFVMSSGRVDISNPHTVDYEKYPIKIARDMAKINVKFATPEVSAKLQMESIHLYNYNHQSFAVPNTVLWNHWKNTTPDPDDNILDPLFDANAARPRGSEPNLDAHYDVEGGEIVNNSCIDWIFTPEQPFSDNDNLCILIEAKQVTLPDGSVHKNRYYKIEFLRRKTSDAKETHINILRNYKYTINITDVGNWGYATLHEAFEHNSEGLIYEIEAIPEDNGITDIAFNGQYQLGVDKPVVDIAAAKDSKSYLKVHTDYYNDAIPNVSWKLEGIIFAQGESAWLTLTPDEGKKGYTTVTLTALNNNPSETTSREATVILSAGNLRKEVIVRQAAGVQIDPVLEYHGGTSLPLLPSGRIVQPGGTYRVDAWTNLQDYRLRVYEGDDNSGKLAIDTPGTTQTVNAASPAYYSTNVDITENDSYFARKYSFYLYSPSEDITVRVGTWLQNPKVYDAAIPIGLLAPPGVLGVTASGELTLRGSKEYRKSSIDGDILYDGTRGHSEFGLVHEETVYTVYYMWGSLIAISSLPVNGTFSMKDVVWVPKEYEYEGLKGMTAMARNLEGLSGAAAWNRVPFNLQNGWGGNVVDGTGDPCPYATVNASGGLASLYRVPKGAPATSGTPGTPATWNGLDAGDLTYTDTNPLPMPGLDKDTRGYVSIADPNFIWRMFLHVSGYRRGTDGAIDTGGGVVFYPSNVVEGTSPRYMYLTYQNGTQTKIMYMPSSYTATNHMATPVRCVKDETLPQPPSNTPKLEYAGTTSLPAGNIARAGGTYRIDAITNLPDGKWGVMVFEGGNSALGTGTLLNASTAFGSKTTSGVYSVDVNIGGNPGSAGRKLSFFLFDSSGSGCPPVHVGIWTQE
ncbi:MAG: hypothetical protein LBV32_03730 [Tannerellaceae bacterium]|jgi:hypothetical protein|nr:hypothetical protein [Tannerellaceae bacterium]